MKYSYKITFEIESNIVPKFVEFALRDILEDAKISVIQGQQDSLKEITITEVKK